MTGTATAPDQIAAARLAPVVTEVVEIRRQIAQLQAREARALAHAGEIADAWAAAEENMSTADLPRRSVAAEFATALRVSDRTVQRQIGEAERMVEMFPETVRSLGAGRISLAHARVIVDAGDRIEQPELVSEYENSVLGYAEAESASRLRPIAKRRAQWFLNETIRERHAAAAATRSVRVHDLDDGMAELQVTGPAVIIHGVHERLTCMARDVAEADAEAIRNARDAVQAAVKAERAESQDGAEPAGSGAKAERNGQSDVDRAKAHLDELLAARRALDAIRVDLLADMLLTAAPDAHTGTTATGLGAIQAHVQVTIPVLTLLDSPADDPFEAVTLAGHGPIDPDTARELARNAPGWDRILTHPISGEVLGVDRYQASSQMRRTLDVRDQHCRFPGCRLPAAVCDLDHTLDWQFGGMTTMSNLSHLRLSHHTLKHQTPWTVVQKPGGVLEWTSPTGRVYPDHPVSSVQFVTDAEFDPAPF